MKRFKMITALMLAAVMLLGVTGCGNGDMDAMKAQMQAMQQQLDAAIEAGFAPSGQDKMPQQDSAAEKEDMVLALHATIDGQSAVPVSGEQLTATAVIPEGMAVDHWALGGEHQLDQVEETFVFTAQQATAVEAVLRPEKKVTSINAQMQFLDEKQKPKGEEFTEFVFEEDYQNPVTKEDIVGGMVTVYVEAEIPSGYDVDYWLINEVPYYFNRTIKSFTVYDLDQTTVYEVVLKKVNAPASTPKATPKPTAKPTPTPDEYWATIAPKEKYTVTCVGCTFSGGGYKNATKGTVTEGTKITVKENIDYSGAVVWINGDYIKGDNWNPGPDSFSYTVKKDCRFECVGIIN